MKIKGLYSAAAVFVEKHRPYFRAGIVCLLLAGMLFVGMTGGGDPIAGAYMNYENQTENEELKQLLTDYYAAYAKGDVDALEKLATPISDKEKSYIKLMSKYIKSYDIKEIETKPGVDRDALLVSVGVDIHYKKLDEAAPGLDFFYVEKDKKGNYIINNRYSTFNAQNGELDVDPTITTLIATFEQQDDVIALQGEVTQAFNALTLENKDFNVFFAKTMPEAVTDWAADYKKKEEKLAKKEAKKEAAAKKKAKEEEKKQEEAKTEESKAEETKEETAKQDTEKADSAEKKTDTVVAKEKVNVRAKASTDARSLGKVNGGTELKRYKEKNGWSKVDYNGTKAWIKSEFLTVKAEDEKKDEETAKEDSKKKTTTKKDDSKSESKEKEETAKKDTTESSTQKDDDTKSDSKKKVTTKKEESAEKSEAKTSTVYAKEKVNVRTKPSTSAKSLGQVNSGTKLTKYKEKSGWSKVDYNGNKAWIKSEFLTTDKPEEQADEPAQDTSSNLSSGQSVRLSAAVNIRKSMDESADRIALAYDGEHVTVVEVYANGWTKVNYNGKEGYMKTEYVK